MRDGLLVAHASGFIAEPVTLGAVGALLGAAITGVVHANRRLDDPAATGRSGRDGVAQHRPRIWGSPTLGLGIVLVSTGLIVGYLSATLLEGTAGVRSPEELVVELCTAARADDTGPAYLELDDDIQHNLTDLVPQTSARATRAAQIVRSAASRPEPLDPELVQLLATELADAAELGGGTPCD